MTSSYQVLRSLVQQRRTYSQIYTRLHNQQLCGVTSARGLHSLRFTPELAGQKVEGIKINRWNRGNILGNGRPTTSLFIIARNESTTTSADTLPDLGKLEQELLNTTKTTSTSTEDLGSASQAQAPSIVQSSTEATNVVSASSVDVSNVSPDALIFESIPEPPAIPLPVDEVTGLLGEPTLASLGLAGWSPSGIVQQCLEFFHVGLGMPWWATIVTGTLIVRIILFPLVIKSQRNAARMQNNMPELQAIQQKMTEARTTGNSLMAAKYAQDMAVFMKEKDVNPLKSLLVPLAMGPVFISFFFGLRGMANLPVESLKTGGMLWFTDLTLCDPYYLLPLITSLTVWVTLELGADGVKLNSGQHSALIKYFMRAIPVVMFPFALNFPAAILCYWVSTNAISLVQVSILKIPKVRDALKIEVARQIPTEMMAEKNKKGFRESFRESWTNMKITREVENRQHFDEISFKRAGRGPIPKTFKYDPTKVSEVTSAIQAQAKRK